MSQKKQQNRWAVSRFFIMLCAVALGLAATPVHGKPQAVVFYGDSLTAAYGLAPEQGYPALIENKIDEAGLSDAFVAQASAVSGETSAGGVNRLNWALAGFERKQQDVGVFMLALGANDGLRGLSVEAMKENLQTIINRVKAKYPHAQLIIAGMLMPPNMGEEYREAFGEAYVDIAKANDAVLIPFLLEGVAGDPKLNQADGIHPNPEGQKIIADRLWQVLEPMLTPQEQS